MEEKHEGDERKVFVFLYLDSLVWRVKFLIASLQNEVVIKMF
jgi:hypothetical protein